MRALFASAFVALAACSSTPPEEKLRATIEQMQKDGEAHDVSGVMDHVAADFGGPGGMDRQALQRLLTFTSMRNRDLGISIGPMDVELIGERATVEFTLAASGGSGGLLPDRGQVYEVTTGWKLVDDEWILISANWKEQL